MKSFKFLISFLLVLVLTSQAYASVSANAIWNMSTSATTTNNAAGCAFIAGATGIDYSKQNTPQWAALAFTAAGAGDTILTTSAATTMVGNILYRTSGTNTTTTNPYYEILSVVAGVSITLSTNVAGASIATGVVSNGVAEIGGACSGNGGTNDATLLTQFRPGNKFYIKNGSYTASTTNWTVPAGAATAPIIVEGYATTQGDRPTGSTRPTITSGSIRLIGSGNDFFGNFIWTGTASSLVTPGNPSFTYDMRVVCTSTSASQIAFAAGTNSASTRMEIISYRGTAFNISGASNNFLTDSYIHSSDKCIAQAASTSTITMIHNIVAGCTTGISHGAALTGQSTYYGNTLYNPGNLGTGFALVSTAINQRWFNNLVTGWATGITGPDSGFQAAGMNNNYWNPSGTNYTSWTANQNDLAVDPAIINTTNKTGSSATTSNTGNTLVKSGENFDTTVTASKSMVYLTGGSSTAGWYEVSSVDSATQLSLNLAPGASSGNVTYYIINGVNFAPGVSLKAKGQPGTFPAGFTKSYDDIGGVQRHEYGR